MNYDSKVITIPYLSIVIPTFNESYNIIKLLESLKKNIGNLVSAEIIIVDDNSPDGTGYVVDDYIKKFNIFQNEKYFEPRIVHRKQKEGLIQAILQGINVSSGKYVLIMDADFSHPPEIIPKIIETLQKNDDCIVIGSRYVEGGSIQGWPFKRRILSSGANLLSRMIFNIMTIKDPMSGFFAFPKKIIQNMQFNSQGYKILLELLVKNKKTKVMEIPFTFTDRVSGMSKMNSIIISDFIQSLWKLCQYNIKAKFKFEKK